MRRLAAGLACLLMLTACGSSSDEESSTSATASPTRTPAATKAGGNDFCAQTKANGVTGASFGELQAWLPKQKLLPDVDEAVDAMANVTPPDEIAAAWKKRKQFLTRMKAALAKLPADGTLMSHPELVSNPSVSKASKAITDYWFEECQ
jgi:hypothetical protein